MARQKGSANFAGTLEVLASAPLDARTRVPAKADLTTSGQFPYPYVGLECYVIAENKKYRLIADDPTDLDNWKEVGGGSSLPSGGDQGQVLTKQSSTEGDADWDDIPHDNTKANSASFAPVETTTTSEHAYEVGDHLMLAGQRYIVTADIAVGDTLDVLTNIQAVNLEDETGLSQADFAEIITPLPGEALDGVIISPEERRVGWYYNMNGDGTKKPVYQKTVSDTMPTCTTQGTFVNKTVSLNASIDKFLGLKCILEGSGSGSTSWFNGLSYELLTAPSFRADGSLNACGMIYCQNNSANTPNTVVLQNGIPGYSGMTVYITIQYTKTT